MPNELLPDPAMPHGLLDIAATVVRVLHPAEHRLDEAFLANTELLAGVLRARHDLNAHPMFGLEAVRAVKEAGDAIFAGMDKQFAAHAMLGAIARKAGMDPAMLGGGTLKDDDSLIAKPLTGANSRPATTASVA